MIYGDPVESKLKFGWENYGWGNVGWDRDTIVSAITPASEIYRIVRWLTEQVYTNELQIENNRSLMLMFAVIQSQSNQQNNFLPWLNKTSLIDVSQTVRNLLPYKRYQFDNEDLVSGYINEVKPYHVYIKNYIYRYTVEENLGVKAVDFDLPAKFNPTTGLFSAPRLVKVATGIPGDYLDTDPIWTDPDYSEWFSNRNVTNPGLDQTRKIKTTIKFDRTSVRPSSRSWVNQIYGWSPTTTGSGWGALPWSQAEYYVGDRVLYNGATYRCIEANSDIIFNVSKWTLVQSDDADVNAIDRIVSYYKGTDDSISFTQADYDKLISNMKYPKIAGFNPQYTLGTTIDWSLPTANSLTVSPTNLADIASSYIPSTVPDTLGFIFGSSVTYIAGITNGRTNNGALLINGNSYWVNTVSATEIAFYPTKTDAISSNAAARISLSGIATNDQFVLGQYPFNTIADDITDNPYWTIDGITGSGTATGPLLPGYEPEELVTGIMTDSVVVSMSGTSVPGSLSSVQNVIMTIDTNNMMWKNIDLVVSPFSEAVIPSYSVDQILSADLPSTGVYHNGTKLEYGTDYTIKYVNEVSSRMILGAEYANRSINFAFYVTPKVDVIGVTRAQYFNNSWF